MLSQNFPVQTNLPKNLRGYFVRTLTVLLTLQTICAFSLSSTLSAANQAKKNYRGFSYFEKGKKRIIVVKKEDKKKKNLLKKFFSKKTFKNDKSSKKSTRKAQRSQKLPKLENEKLSLIGALKKSFSKDKQNSSTKKGFTKSKPKSSKKYTPSTRKTGAGKKTNFWQKLTRKTTQKSAKSSNNKKAKSSSKISKKLTKNNKSPKNKSKNTAKKGSGVVKSYFSSFFKPYEAKKKAKSKSSAKSKKVAKNTSKKASKNTSSKAMGGNSKMIKSRSLAEVARGGARLYEFGLLGNVRKTKKRLNQGERVYVLKSQPGYSKISAGDGQEYYVYTSRLKPSKAPEAYVYLNGKLVLSGGKLVTNNKKKESIFSLSPISANDKQIEEDRLLSYRVGQEEKTKLPSKKEGVKVENFGLFGE